MEKFKHKLFKILPLYEGKVEGENIYIDPQTAYEQYMDYLGIMIIEFSGYDTEPFTDIVHNLKGMKNVGKDITHSQVKKMVFGCISMLGE